ncbi:DUF2461 domain-containing protein [Tundrisphaera lichenicola]|uniref:DUF2461 domain-containing protein n=1 Tax=Tundrisphaera lichenicola TaxID=2029860 RepID=UPI003EBE7B23
MAAKKVAGDPGGFRGFGSQALPFLRALKENNDRDWFASNKATFLEECDAPLRELVGEVGGRLASKGIDLAPMPRNPVFRIYRDVRFSNDKSPYKTNVGAALHRQGDKSRPGLLYIHVEPAGSFLAAGFYRPEAPTLKLLREAVADDADRFLGVIEAVGKKGNALGMGEPLTRLPRGFEGQADSPVASYIRFRSFVVHHPLSDDDLERRDLPERIVRFAEEVLPFLDFFWSKIGA